MSASASAARIAAVAAAEITLDQDSEVMTLLTSQRAIIEKEALEADMSQQADYSQMRRSALGRGTA